MKILLTGFEPFGESPLNPSQMLVDSFSRSVFGKIKLDTAILPVEQEKGPAQLLAAVDSLQPDAVLCFGLAMGRSRISLERVAINLMDYRIPDNNGNIVTDQPIIQDGPAAYFSTLPLRTIQEALLDNDIPAELSLSAGAYICNQVLYSLLHHIAIHQRHIPAGFIHLPALPEQAANAKKAIPSMDFNLMQNAARLMIDVLAGSRAAKTEGHP
jgi:pyroglutamyl-peptidase